MLAPINIQEYFEDCICLKPDTTKPFYFEKLTPKITESLNFYQSSKNPLERKKLVVVIAVLLKLNKLNYSFLKDSLLASIVTGKLFIC